MTHEERRLLCLVARTIADANDEYNEHKGLAGSLRKLAARVQRQAAIEEHKRNVRVLVEEADWQRRPV